MDYYSYGGQPVPSEFYWTRLQYNSYGAGNGFGGYGGGWSQDYPKADNDCLIALRRLTHINSPAPLNVADLDSDHFSTIPGSTPSMSRVGRSPTKKPSACTIIF